MILWFLSLFLLFGGAQLMKKIFLEIILLFNIITTHIFPSANMPSELLLNMALYDEKFTNLLTQTSSNFCKSISKQWFNQIWENEGIIYFRNRKTDNLQTSCKLYNDPIEIQKAIFAGKTAYEATENEIKKLSPYRKKIIFNSLFTWEIPLSVINELHLKQKTIFDYFDCKISFENIKGSRISHTINGSKIQITTPPLTLALIKNNENSQNYTIAKLKTLNITKLEDLKKIISLVQKLVEDWLKKLNMQYKSSVLFFKIDIDHADNYINKTLLKFFVFSLSNKNINSNAHIKIDYSSVENTNSLLFNFYGYYKDNSHVFTQNHVKKTIMLFPELRKLKQFLIYDANLFKTFKMIRKNSLLYKIVGFIKKETTDNCLLKQLLEDVPEKELLFCTLYDDLSTKKYTREQIKNFITIICNSFDKQRDKNVSKIQSLWQEYVKHEENQLDNILNETLTELQ